MAVGAERVGCHAARAAAGRPACGDRADRWAIGLLLLASQGACAVALRRHAVGSAHDRHGHRDPRRCRLARRPGAPPGGPAASIRFRRSGTSEKGTRLKGQRETGEVRRSYVRTAQGTGQPLGLSPYTFRPLPSPFSLLPSTLRTLTARLSVREPLHQTPPETHELGGPSSPSCGRRRSRGTRRRRRPCAAPRRRRGSTRSGRLRAAVDVDVGARRPASSRRRARRRRSVFACRFRRARRFAVSALALATPIICSSSPSTCHAERSAEAPGDGELRRTLQRQLQRAVSTHRQPRDRAAVARIHRAVLLRPRRPGGP